MRSVKQLIIHCSDSPDDLDVGFIEVNNWHKERHWESESGVHCGYHFIIRRNGVIEVGRTADEIGAHCKGANGDSIGICLIGTKKFDQKQFDSLIRLVTGLKRQYVITTVAGHRDYPTAIQQGKTCPNFEVKKVL